MRQTNIFRTTKRDHHIPRHIMIYALTLSPGKDWTDPDTAAFDYLKDWALNQDVKIDGPPKEESTTTQQEIRDMLGNLTQKWEGYKVPLKVIEEAYKLSPGISIHDKRTKAYKHIKAWTDGKETQKTN